MNLGFLKIGTFTPRIKVADVSFNVNNIKKGIDEAINQNCDVVVFPELSLTGYTCFDLFNFDVFRSAVIYGVREILEFSKNKNILIIIGFPFVKGNVNYDVAGVISNGSLLALIPKQNLCNYNSFYEKRYFSSYKDENSFVDFDGNKVAFGNKILFTASNKVRIAIEIGSDALMPISPSSIHAINGANVIINCNASPHVIGYKEKLEQTIKSISYKLNCIYAVCSSGEGESTTDSVYSGYNLICENGDIIAESKPFNCGLITAQTDIDFVNFERLKTFNQDVEINDDYLNIPFAINESKELNRFFSKTPFIPSEEKMDKRAEEILNIQAQALKSRINFINAKNLVLGLSGGLDSTLALLVSVRALKLLDRPMKDLIAVTMPCFGTTNRTFDNTIKLSKALGVTLKKVDIGKAVKRHLKDINHADNLLDVTYENAQARERTQVLMDIANMNNGVVIGTGDLSEVALGWSTYNGDHMSMYGVNASVPKTLVKYIVSYVANKSRGKLKATLLDILDTPVSPELLPPSEDKIAQKTEDIVGPYMLHDFFLYHFIRRGTSPRKLYEIAKTTFNNQFDDQTILKWLKVFTKRFFMQQFKRSCMPDGVKVGAVALSPRGDWKMPSDASSSLWLNELDDIK